MTSAPKAQDCLPLNSGFLPLDNCHSMYWQQSGNLSGKPVVVLHGGPGAGINPANRHSFDPHFYRVIEYDQRGAGRSTPAGELRDNSTSLLVADLERLRLQLGVEQWMVAGGSWGSSLALAYAQQFPTRVSSLLLRGVFLCEESEVRWFFDDLKHVYPEAWNKFIGFLPIAQRHDPLRFYQRYLHASDPAVNIAAARSWCRYETSCSTLLPVIETGTAFTDQQALILARIQAHYFNEKFFLEQGSLLHKLNKIQTIPCTIVHGRYDMICPAHSAFKLHTLWPESELRIVPNAGHAASEPGIRRALTAAAEKHKSYQTAHNRVGRTESV